MIKHSTYHVYLFIILFSGIVSCKKTDTGTPSEKKYPVRIQMQGIDAQTAATSNHADELRKYLSNLFCIIYDEKGDEVKKILQLPSQEHFGTLADSLPKGNYTLVFLGNATSINDSYRDYPDISRWAKAPLSEASLSLADDNSGDIKPAHDIFFKKIAVQIGNEDEGTTRSIKLERIVGSLEVVIEDPIPSAAYHFFVDPLYESRYFMFASELPSEPEGEYEYGYFFKNSDKGKRGLKFQFFILNTAQPIDVYIRCNDASFNALAEKTISNIRIQRNKRTILKGKLFDQQAAFSVKNCEWNSDSVVVTY